MSVSGVILPPPRYLSSVLKLLRSSGGLAIFDEVQTCCGRLGTFWGHSTIDLEFGGVTPDIVCCGKPLGNGVPLAATICRKDVVSGGSFSQVEYFNTFGGNPVSKRANPTLCPYPQTRPNISY
jgi:ethanolamine-phosphate phospho-lyase